MVQEWEVRSFQSALEVGRVRADFPTYFCENCGKKTIYRVCETCGQRCKQVFYFPDSGEESFKPTVEGSEKKGVPFRTFDLDIRYYFEKAVEKLGFSKENLPPLIKGVRGTFSQNHTIENLCKGILRAKYGLQVNKDGTIRYDATEMPLTHFRPREIGTSIEKLRELGYEEDIYGNPLVSDDQILELFPHDILLPSPSKSLDERADDVFVKICNFVDELLEKFYGLEPFYKVESREDLIGHLGAIMAPHNCAGVICRFIGFSNALGVLASPYMHAAVRRDCDGDEAAIMLLGDVLLNFSRKFLPSHRGGTQDAPLVLNAKINAGEVDDQILDFELVSEYPLELYRLAEQRKHSSKVKIHNVEAALKNGENPFTNIGFTHDTSDIGGGVVCSSYKSLTTMQEKVEHQMGLIEKLRSVDASSAARLIIERHFIRDMRGNLRKFSMQNFRCVVCNEIMRRPPLTGVCPACGGKIIFTIHEGGIRKYLDLALELARKYNLSKYVQQNLELIKRYVDSIFGKENEKQEALKKWF